MGRKGTAPSDSSLQRPGPWHPSIDVVVEGAGLVVRVDIAGVPPADVALDVRDGVLVISGHRPKPHGADAETLFLIWIFFVAGADAGTIVLGSMSSGVLDPSTLTKLTWGVIMGALAAILLVAGGLDALQDGAILAATPFVVIMIMMCVALHRAMSEDLAGGHAPDETRSAAR